MIGLLKEPLPICQSGLIPKPNGGHRDKDLGTAWQMLLTKVDLSLQRRLSLYCIPINSVIGGALTISSS